MWTKTLLWQNLIEVVIQNEAVKSVKSVKTNGSVWLKFCLRTRCRWHNSLPSFEYYVDWWFSFFLCVTYNTCIGSTNNKEKFITIKLWHWRTRLSIFANYSPFHLRVLRDLVVMSYKTNTWRTFKSLRQMVLAADKNAKNFFRYFG